MYLIGAVSKKDIKAIKKTGYEIEKIIKPQAFNALFGKKGSTIDPDAEDMAIVYVDCDLLEQLQEWAAEEKGKLQAKIAQELRDLQEKMAQEAFESSDLNGLKCEESDGWEQDGEYWNKRFYFENEENPSDGSKIATFVVIFKKGTDKVIDSHVNIH